MASCGGCDCAWSPAPPDISLNADVGVTVLAILIAVVSSLSYFSTEQYTTHFDVVSKLKQWRNLSQYTREQFHEHNKYNVGSGFDPNAYGQKLMLPMVGVIEQGRTGAGTMGYVYRVPKYEWRNGKRELALDASGNVETEPKALAYNDPDSNQTPDLSYYDLASQKHVQGKLNRPLLPEHELQDLGKYREMLQRNGIVRQGEGYAFEETVGPDGRTVWSRAVRADGFHARHENRWSLDDEEWFRAARVWRLSVVLVVAGHVLSSLLTGVLAFVHPAQPAVQHVLPRTSFALLFFAAAIMQLTAGALQYTDSWPQRRRALFVLEFTGGLVYLFWGLPSLSVSGTAGWMATLAVLLFVWRTVRTVLAHMHPEKISLVWPWLEVCVIVPLWAVALLAVPCQA